MKGQTYVVLGVIVVIIVSIFAVINVAPVNVNYLFWTGESPLILVILFSVLMGVLISAAVASYRIIHLQRELKKVNLERVKIETILSDHDLLTEPDQTLIDIDETKTIEK